MVGGAGLKLEISAGKTLRFCQTSINNMIGAASRRQQAGIYRLIALVYYYVDTITLCILVLGS